MRAMSSIPNFEDTPSITRFKLGIAYVQHCQESTYRSPNDEPSPAPDPSPNPPPLPKVHSALTPITLLIVMAFPILH